jgi:6-phosphogluconolactonase (cycloisomerase 2 family)
MSEKHSWSVGRTWVPVLLALILPGCGGSSTNPIPCSGTTGNNPACISPEFLYATATGEILGFTVDRTTGTLSAPTTTRGPSLTLANRTQPTLGIVSVAKQGFLYVSDPQNSRLDGFAVNNSTGALTPLSGSPFPLPGPFRLPGGMATDPQGKFLFVANGFIDAFAINSASGALTAVHGSPFASAAVSEIAVDGSGKFLFASFGDHITALTIDPTSGTLTPVPGSPFALPNTKSIAFGLTVDSSGRFLYAVVEGFPIGATNNAVAGFSIDATSGALTPISGTPQFSGFLAPLAIATSGSFLYVRSALGISAFNIASGTGALSEISGSPFPAGTASHGMAVSPDGRFLYEAAVNAIDVFAIDPTTGAVSTIGNPVPVGSRPAVLSLYNP